MIEVQKELQKTEDLLSVIKQETGHDAELDDKLEALGVDSLEFVCLMQAVEKKFGLTIPDRAWAHIETVRDIRKHL